MKSLAYILVLVVLSTVVACKNKYPSEAPELPVEQFRDGDIAFRQGIGIMSRIVVAASKDGVYSHIGILKKEGNDWFVIHAVPGEPDFKGDPDRVKMEPIARFFAPDRACMGAIMRCPRAQNAAVGAANRAVDFVRRGTLFDHEYDLNDTTKMYCTELIDYVYHQEGIDLLDDNHLGKTSLPVKGGECILPDDIAGNAGLITIFSFSR